MARTNPYKKKRRYAQKTFLLYGEGLGEEMFLKHLRGLYSRDSGTAVKIRKGKGGSAVDIIFYTEKEPGEFDCRIAILDNDKEESEMEKAREEAKKRKIKIFEHNPCLEAILLSILDDSTNYADKGSAWCKHEFESKYIEKSKRMDKREYERIFPQILLDGQSSKIPELALLISLMEGRLF